jgi:hypothetical protein
MALVANDNEWSRYVGRFVAFGNGVLLGSAENEAFLRARSYSGVDKESLFVQRVPDLTRRAAVLRELSLEEKLR